MPAPLALVVFATVATGVPRGDWRVEELARKLRSRNAEIQQVAAAALGRMGPQAAAAVGALEDALRSVGENDLPAIAAWALGEIGRAAVPPLIRALETHNENVRHPVIAALARIGVDAVPALTAALAHDDAYVRDAAAETLGRIGPGAKAAIPALVESSKTRSASESAIAALGRIGSANPDAALPTLIAALDDRKDERRLAATVSLGHLGPSARPAIPALVEQLSSRYGALRAAAAATLGGLGSDARAAVPALTKALDDPNGYVRSVVETALRQIH